MVIATAGLPVDFQFSYTMFINNKPVNIFADKFEFQH